MTIREILWAVFLALAGVLSAGVTLYGMYSAIRVDFRQDTVLTVAYCTLPFLCLPVFLVFRPPHRAASLLTFMALTYLGVYSALNWRTCSALGYCESVTATVLLTLSTNVVLAYFAVVALSLLAQLVDDRPSLWRGHS